MPMPGVTVSETVQNLNALRLRPGSARASGSAGAHATPDADSRLRLDFTFFRHYFL